MGRLGVAGMVAALLALAACGASQEREKKAQELAAAEKKGVDTRAFNEGLEREKKLLAGQLAEAEAKGAEVRSAYHGTLAGAAYLANEGHGLTLDADMSAAGEGFLLAEAARQQDRKDIEALAARVLADERPCAGTEDEQEGEGEGGCGPCEVAPFEDACIGVETNLSSSLDWTCATVARAGKGVPPAAFCTSTLEHPAPGANVDSPYAERALPTALQVVRIAFTHQGRLYVSDYPKPEPTLYNPPNVEPLVACKASTARNECIHACEVSFERYQDPCACTPDYYEPEHDDSEETEEEEEPYEVRQARLAAEQAEAAAEEARKRAEEAQQEVSYQECLAACEPEREVAEESQDAENAETHVEPVSTTVTARLEATPAPGIFVVSREVRALSPGNDVMEEEKGTLVLRHPALVALWQKEPLPASEALGAIETVGQLDEVVRDGGKPSLAPLRGMEGPTLVGLSGGKVKAYAFKTQPGQELVVELDPEAVCEALHAEPKRFPETFLKACPEPSAAAAAEPEEGAPAAPEAAGDAGVSAVAGEVAP